MNIIITIVVLTLGFVSCSNNRELNFALDFAGENSAELQAVLDNYDKGTEQYCAARYLIENMPYQFSVNSPSLDMFKDQIPSITDSIPGKLIVDMIDKSNEMCTYPNDAEIIFDAHVITSDYLIKHIDYMFELKKLPWNKDLTFSEFCETLLPYRIENEPLEEWVTTYSEYFQPIIDSIAKPDDILLNASAIVDHIIHTGSVFVSNLGSKPSYGSEFLLRTRVGECRESTQLTLYAMRSVGIPCSIDRYLHSPTFNGAHQWNVIKDANGEILPFWINEHSLKQGSKLDRKAGKIYRNTYAINGRISSSQTFEETILKIKSKRSRSIDVTSQYYGNNHVQVNVSSHAEINSKCAYLSVFSRGNYLPIDIAEIKNDKASFLDIEPEVIYQLTTHGSTQNTELISYPFMYVGDDSIHYFKPHTSNLSKVIIKRKYLMRSRLTQRMNNIFGAKIYAAHHQSMTSKEQLYTVDDTISTPYNIFIIDSNIAYKYLEVKYDTSLVRLDISKIEIFSNSESIDFKILNDSVFISYPNIVDDDLVSYSAVGKDGSLIIELSKRVRIDSICYTPVNDDNFIEKGQRYELLYNDGSNGWISLGEQIAMADSLIFDIPKNSLLWLRNHTKGVEEQVFFEVDGMQQFPPKLL